LPVQALTSLLLASERIDCLLYKQSVQNISAVCFSHSTGPFYDPLMRQAAFYATPCGTKIDVV
jgi:hypothetical protein